mmetsp:Transcript_12531/g.35892  ORF Transcript_12531/g.35892 Transcript_12531/m.35892 type:complete len:113 (-) Transcript_12531:97-435(-)
MQPALVARAAMGGLESPSRRTQAGELPSSSPRAQPQSGGRCSYEPRIEGITRAMYEPPRTMAAKFSSNPNLAMVPTGISPVEYTTMFGPPAIGSMKAKEDEKHTASRNFTGS